jgi:membrane-bound lytic murein transglycosylase A
MLKNFLIISIFLLSSSCLFSKKITINTQGRVKLMEVDYADLKNWQNDDHIEALKAFTHSCRKFSKMNQSTIIAGQLGNISVGDYRDVCEIAEVLKNLSSKQTKNFFENWFRPFLVINKNNDDNGLFTGYYEPTLNGSKTKTDKYKFPVYAKPKNLSNDINFFTRSEIENGALKNKNLEILYVDDKVDLFFAHIQGSMKVKMNDGRFVKLSYSGKNNQPFIAIANPMIEKNLLSRSTANSATVRNWLKENIDQADEIMNLNHAYTFYKIFDAEYVVGAQNVPLTPLRSLAIDNEIIPYGSLLWVETKTKNNNGDKQDFNHLMVAQDTGSAIKGAIRGDIFFGNGKQAEELAFNMASKGKYYILLPIAVLDKMLQK